MIAAKRSAGHQVRVRCERERRRRRSCQTAVVCAAVLCALIAVETCSIQAATGQMMSGPRAAAETDDAGERASADSAARVARIRVEGTDIDCALAQDRPDLVPGYFLDHDAQCRATRVGCAFIDRRSSSDARHVLVYGHNLGFGKGMFSQLKGAWRQPELERIGVASLSAPDGATRRFLPVCAIRVDEGFADVQRFGFRDNEDLRRWIAKLACDATAKADGWERRVWEAERALTMVTCASTRTSEQRRTLIVFVG